MSVEVKTTFKPTNEAASAWREETNLQKLSNKNGLWKKLFHLFQIHIELWNIIQPSMAGGNLVSTIIYSSPTVY